MFARCLALISLITLTACGSRIYDESRPGEFTGSLIVMWVGGDGGNGGDGNFVYVPDLDDQGRALAFTRGTQTDGRDLNVTRVEPEWMYTDGGSVPRLVQPVRGLNPWGYAPAYMVHDWLFVARKCLNDNMATPEEAAMANVTFRESFEVMAEMLKTLEESDQLSESDLQPSAITWAVSSGISKNLWQEVGKCEDNRITEEHRKQIEARLRIGQEGKQLRVQVDGESVTPARVVQVIGF